MKRSSKVAWLFIFMLTAFAVNLTQLGVVDAWDYNDTRIYFNYHGNPTIINTALGPGTTFKVNITVNYIEQLAGFQFELGRPAFWDVDPEKYRGWDPSVLNLTSVELGPFLESAGGTAEWYPGTINNTQGTLDLTMAILDPLRRFSSGENGTLATLTFKVLSRGSTSIRFSRDTALLNKTAGWEWDGIPLKGTTAEGPRYEFLVDGYFDNRPQVHVVPKEVRAVPVGENFTVGINVINITGVHSWALSMKWNGTLLNVTQPIEGDFLPSAGTTTFYSGDIENTLGEINDITSTLTDADKEASGSGTLVNLTFVPTETGRTDINISSITLLDSKGNSIVVGVTNSTFSNIKFHNIEVTSVTVVPTEVEERSNQTISINVTITNTGSYNETGISVNVTASSDETKYSIGNQSIPLLTNETFSKENPSYNYTTTLSFTWDTTNVARGIYIISANASFVEDEEERADNVKTIEAMISAHDVAIDNVFTDKSHVVLGHNLTVKVDVSNKGTYAESFSVTAYYTHGDVKNEIGTINVIELDYKESFRHEFVLDTTGLEEGNYTLSAEASNVTGEKPRDLANNVFVKPDPVELRVAVTEPYSTEFLILIASPFVVVAIVAVYYVRKRKTPET